MPSFVWDFFEKIDLQSARCNEKCCKRVFKWKKGTAAMIQHLKNDHNITEGKSFKRPATSHDECSSSKRQKNLPEYFKQSTLEEEVVRMVAEKNLKSKSKSADFRKSESKNLIF